MERYVIEIVAVKRTRDVPLARHGPQDSSVSLPLTNTYGSSYVPLLGRSYWYITRAIRPSSCLPMIA